MKIKAAVLERTDATYPYADSKPLVVQEVDLAGPGKNEVMIRMVAAGVCHSDLSVIDGTRPRPVPMVLGHEAAGIVHEVGEGVTDLEVGDHVVCVFVPSCGQCEPCAEGRPALCEPAAVDNSAGDLTGAIRRLSKDGKPLAHHVGISGFAEYATLSRRSLFKVEKDIPLDVVALFSCAVLTGVGAVLNTAEVKAGSSVAVIGLGGVGLAAMLGAIGCGAGRIVAIDLNEEKLKVARELGATDCFNAADPDIVEKVKAATGGGVDAAVELAGVVPALETAFAVTKRGGTTVTGGLPHPDAKLALSPLLLVAEERSLKGSYIGSCIPSRDLHRMMNMYRRGILPVDKLMTHRMPLEDINLALDQLKTGKAIRQIIHFDS